MQTRALEPNQPLRIIRVFAWKTIRCPETRPSKQASIRNSARSLTERRAEPLGNLNKGLPSAPRVAYPLMRHAQPCKGWWDHMVRSRPLVLAASVAGYRALCALLQTRGYAV